MKKRGFTLVEIIGVILIIAILLIIVIPIVNNSSQKGKEKLYETKVTTANQQFLM